MTVQGINRGPKESVYEEGLSVENEFPWSKSKFINSVLSQPDHSHRKELDILNEKSQTDDEVNIQNSKGRLLKICKEKEEDGKIKWRNVGWKPRKRKI